MVLAGDSRVILLDEPMAGVSMEDVPELVELIRSVHVDEGKTVLLVEHHMEVVTGLAQRIAVLHHGSLLAVDTPEAIMRNETVQQAYLGEPSSDALLAIRDLHVHLGESHVLQGVAFDVPEGGVTALLGRNGVGKTTTLRALMGLVERRGTIELDGARRHLDADAQDRPAWRRLRPGGPRRLREPHRRRESSARRARRRAAATSSSTTSSPS